MATELDARVRQKADTIAGWMANDLTSLDGEQLFIRSDVDNNVIGFKFGSEGKVFSELPYIDLSVRDKCSTSTVWTGKPSGVYVPTENGNYGATNGNVDLSQGYQIIFWDGITRVKVVFPSDLTGYATKPELNEVESQIENKADLEEAVSYLPTTNVLSEKIARTPDVYVNATGGLTTASGSGYETVEIPWGSATNLVTAFSESPTNFYSAAQYNASGVFISGTYQGTNTAKSIAKNSGATLVKLTIRNTIVNQVNRGNVVLPYESNVPIGVGKADGGSAVYKPDPNDPGLLKALSTKKQGVGYTENTNIVGFLESFPNTYVNTSGGLTIPSAAGYITYRVNWGDRWALVTGLNGVAANFYSAVQKQANGNNVTGTYQGVNTTNIINRLNDTSAYVLVSIRIDPSPVNLVNQINFGSTVLPYQAPSPYVANATAEGIPAVFKPNITDVDLLALVKRSNLTNQKSIDLWNNDFTNAAWSMGAGWSVTDGIITGTGVGVPSSGPRAMLNREYGMEEVACRVKFKASANAIVGLATIGKEVDPTSLFSHVIVDCAAGNFYIAARTDAGAAITTPVSFTFNANREYQLETFRKRGQFFVRLRDTVTGQTWSTQRDYTGTYTDIGCIDRYVLYLKAGTSVSMSSFSLSSKRPRVVFMGDSITEGAQLTPVVGSDIRWADKMITEMGVSGLVNGRRSGTIIGVTEKALTTELPFILPDYLIVTIGTNPGNTEANLTALVNGVRAFGVEIVLNHIPCHTLGVHVERNAIIKSVCDKLKVPSMRFDIATALNNDPSQGLDPALFAADGVHPNEAGGIKMYERLAIDCPLLLNYNLV